ncbi:MAG: hypothetical protein HC923_12235, partial [Myxococcales bacterium]|nr:hypothetical protein [Myxococcales bacterium]
MTIGTDALFLRHDPGYGHPERKERLSAIEGALAGLDHVVMASRPATRDELRLALLAAALPHLLEPVVDQVELEGLHRVGALVGLHPEDALAIP